MRAVIWRQPAQVAERTLLSLAQVRHQTARCADFGGVVIDAKPTERRRAKLLEQPRTRLVGPMAGRRSNAERALRMGHSPDLVAKAIVRAAERNSGVVPVGIESALAYRVLRFAPGYGIGGIFNDDLAVGYGAQGTSGPTGIYGPQGALPPPTNVRGTPRPPRSVPHVASRTVPVPKANPLAAKPAAEPAPQSAARQPTPWIRTSRDRRSSQTRICG